MNFHHFTSILAKDYIFLSDIILQWNLGLVVNIEKYFNKFVPPYMAYSQNMVKLLLCMILKNITNLIKLKD